MFLTAAFIRVCSRVISTVGHAGFSLVRIDCNNPACSRAASFSPQAWNDWAPESSREPSSALPHLSCYVMACTSMTSIPQVVSCQGRSPAWLAPSVATLSQRRGLPRVKDKGLKRHSRNQTWPNTSGHDPFQNRDVTDLQATRGQPSCGCLSQPHSQPGAPIH